MNYSVSSVLMQALISMHASSVILNAVLERFETFNTVQSRVIKTLGTMYLTKE